MSEHFRDVTEQTPEQFVREFTEQGGDAGEPIQTDMGQTGEASAVVEPAPEPAAAEPIPQPTLAKPILPKPWKELAPNQRTAYRQALATWMQSLRGLSEEERERRKALPGVPVEMPDPEAGVVPIPPPATVEYVPPPPQPIPRGAPNHGKPNEEMGWAFINWLAYLEPAWKDRIEALMTERHIGPVNAVGLLAGWTLESGEQMEISILPQLMDEYAPSGTRQICPQCDKPYTLAYPQQPFCRNECAQEWRALHPNGVVPVVGVDTKPWPEMNGQERAAHMRQMRKIRYGY